MSEEAGPSNKTQEPTATATTTTTRQGLVVDTNIYQNEGIEAPPGYQYFSEGQANILYADINEVFYNPVQEFNRDLSILMIKMFQQSLEAEGKGRPLRILEALSATGLRSVRYAKEIPNLANIVSNDLDEAAVESIRRNAEFNKVGHIITPNKGDATVVMMQYRDHKQRFDVVDLDPYGSPAQFLDSAVQCVADGGLLCVTATDMAVLCGAHQSTCMNKYGAITVKGKNCHEMGLRILLNCISQHAARYKRYIVPVLSVSVDFYCRVFVRVYTSASTAKASICKLSYVYMCSGCESHFFQAVGRESGAGNFVVGYGPTVPQDCQECGKKFQMGGPIWTPPIHNKEVLDKALAHLEVEENANLYNTSKRIYGLVTVMSEELPDVPLFVTVPQMCNVLHVTQPAMHPFRSALVAQGYKVSISHTDGASVKTDAPMSVLWDVMRSWNKLHPAKNPSPTSPAFAILAKEPKIVADFTPIKEAQVPSRNVPRFLPNPKKNWGPGSRATGKKRSADKIMSIEERRVANQNKRIKKLPCTFFAKGKCTKGDKCTYLHGDEVPAADDTPMVNSDNDSNNNNNNNNNNNGDNSTAT